MVLSRERCFTSPEFKPPNATVGESFLIIKPWTSNWNNSLYAQSSFWRGFTWAFITLKSNSPGITIPWSSPAPAPAYTQIPCWENSRALQAWECCRGHLLCICLASMPSSSGITNWFSSSYGQSTWFRWLRGLRGRVCYQVWPVSPSLQATVPRAMVNTWPSRTNQNPSPWLALRREPLSPWNLLGR